jgi:hypothetical protein
MKWNTLREGDYVRTAIKNSAMTKAHHPKFSTQTYKIQHINVREDGTRAYLLANHPDRKPHYRWELQRVDSAEDKDTVD